MPGVSKENLEVSVEGSELRVYGKRSVPEPSGEYVVRERRAADFYQAYTIDETIDRERIDAKLENGVLLLTLNLKESQKPRKIDVKSS
jgi:HSP20 family protein